MWNNKIAKYKTKTIKIIIFLYNKQMKKILNYSNYLFKMISIQKNSLLKAKIIINMMKIFGLIYNKLIKPYLLRRFSWEFKLICNNRIKIYCNNIRVKILIL